MSNNPFEIGTSNIRERFKRRRTPAVAIIGIFVIGLLVGSAATFVGLKFWTRGQQSAIATTANNKIQAVKTEWEIKRLLDEKEKCEKELLKINTDIAVAEKIIKDTQKVATIEAQLDHDAYKNKFLPQLLEIKKLTEGILKSTKEQLARLHVE